MYFLMSLNNLWKSFFYTHSISTFNHKIYTCKRLNKCRKIKHKWKFLSVTILCGPLPCGWPLWAARTLSFQTPFCVCTSIHANKRINQWDIHILLLSYKTKSCSAFSCLYGELLGSQGNTTITTIPSHGRAVTTGGPLSVVLKCQGHW